MLANLTRRRVKTRIETLIYHHPPCVLANLTRRRIKKRTETLIYHHPPCVLANLTRRRVKIRNETLIHHYPLVFRLVSNKGIQLVAYCSMVLCVF